RYYRVRAAAGIMRSSIQGAVRVAAAGGVGGRYGLRVPRRRLRHDGRGGFPEGRPGTPGAARGEAARGEERARDAVARVRGTVGALRTQGGLQVRESAV